MVYGSVVLSDYKNTIQIQSVGPTYRTITLLIYKDIKTDMKCGLDWIVFLLYGNGIKMLYFH